MLTKLHYMMKKYAFEYEKVTLQGKYVGIKRVKGNEWLPYFQIASSKWDLSYWVLKSTLG